MEAPAVPVTILVENYPTVTSTKLYQEVIQGLKDKAESIQAAVRVHNANIRTYNVLRQSFFEQIFAPISFPGRQNPVKKVYDITGQ